MRFAFKEKRQESPEDSVDVPEDYNDTYKDPEVNAGSVDSQSIDEFAEQRLEIYTDHRLNHSRFKWFWRASQYIDGFGEARGVERQQPKNRVPTTFLQCLRLAGVWVGGCLSIPSMTGFFLGSLMFNLSFRASVSSGVLGVFAGSVVGSFGATMGPRSGIRAMMGAKYQFGWWFSRFIALLNSCTGVGWLLVNGFFGGQLLNALSNGSVSNEVGLVILFVVCLIVTVFGMKLLTSVEVFFIIPLFVAFLLCYVCTGHEFDVSNHSKVSGEDLNTAWVSNFQSCIGITSTWLGMGADYHLDMPEGTNKKLLYLCVLLVMFLSTTFVGILGCGLASAGLYNPAKKAIYDNLGGAGLIVDGMRRWGGGGKFLVVIMYLSLFTNGVITCYSVGLSLQTLATPIARIPRYILVVFVSCLWYGLAAAGQSGWSQVVSNFLPMIGYWSMMYASILMIETLWFRRHAKDEYQWDQYLNKKHFPIMWAAMISFGVGIAGVVIGMDQYYYVGRLARVVGKGCELGTLLAFGFTTVTYIPLRYLEIRWRNETPIRP